MAEATPMQGTVTEVDVPKESFKIAEGNVWVSHTKEEWRRGLGPPLAVGCTITFQGSQSNGRWYANDIAVISMPHPSNTPPPAASYAGMPQAAAKPNPPAPTPTPVAEPPRNGPESVTPVLGTQAYRDISIPKQVALKTAIDLLVGTYGGTASDEKAHIELTRLAMNAMAMAEQFYEHFLNNSEIGVADVAMPDDTLVPTPSEQLTGIAASAVQPQDGDPGPQEPR